MSPEAQRIAIAESVGWEPSGKTGIWYHVKLGFRTMQESAVHKKRIEMGLGDANSMMPDYLNDLNAMHQTALALKDRDGKAYLKYLRELIKTDGWYYPDATAAQRAEAYLRTIGKWKEGDDNCQKDPGPTQI